MNYQQYNKKNSALNECLSLETSKICDKIKKIIVQVSINCIIWLYENHFLQSGGKTQQQKIKGKCDFKYGTLPFVA